MRNSSALKVAMVPGDLCGDGRTPERRGNRAPPVAAAAVTAALAPPVRWHAQITQ